METETSQTTSQKSTSKGLKQGKWVAIHNGHIVGTGNDPDKLFRGINKRGIESAFIYQVRNPKRQTNLRPYIVEGQIWSLRLRW